MSPGRWWSAMGLWILWGVNMTHRPINRFTFSGRRLTFFAPARLVDSCSSQAVEFSTAITRCSRGSIQIVTVGASKMGWYIVYIYIYNKNNLVYVYIYDYLIYIWLSLFFPNWKLVRILKCHCSFKGFIFILSVHVVGKATSDRLAYECNSIQL